MRRRAANTHLGVPVERGLIGNTDDAGDLAQRPDLVVRHRLFEEVEVVEAGVDEHILLAQGRERECADGSRGAHDAQRERRSDRRLHLVGVVDTMRRNHEARGRPAAGQPRRFATGKSGYMPNNPSFGPGFCQ